MKAMAAAWSLIIVIVAIIIFMIGSKQSSFSWLESLKLFSSEPVTTQNETAQQIEPHYEKLSDNDLRIFSIEWGYGNCNRIKDYTLMNCRDESFPRYPNGTCLIKAGYADVNVRCEKNNLYCEVYVNGKRSDFAPNGLQKCENEIFIAENSISENNFYTDLNENKDILICCSYLDSTSTKILRDYEICKSTTLKAYCQ